MTIETIDNVLYYVWRAGDELPKYQPICCELCVTINHVDKEWQTDISRPYNWIDCPRRWPKLLNDRAQHQRMIDEAFEKVTYATFEQVEDALFDRVVDLSANYIKYSVEQLALCGALVKRMMEYVQAEIDAKAKEPNTTCNNVKPEEHTEIIICPNCHNRQTAKVAHTQPFWSYVHECDVCDFIIGESEWDRVELDKDYVVPTKASEAKP